jgi:POT family proton-dependent oligopeptide transporter
MKMSYRTAPVETSEMPPGISHIIGNEVAERFSFYGMKAVLAVYLTQYLFLMDGADGVPMDENRSTELIHLFNGAFYLTPFIGAILADVFFGKYRVIMMLSLVYCAGHALLAMMGLFGNSESWMLAGLALIALGAGGIKPCVSAHVGDQFGSLNSHLLSRTFNWFYFSINLGAFLSMLLTPWLLEWYGPHWAFGVPGCLMGIATFVFWLGRHRFAHVPAGGVRFLKEAFGKEGLIAMLKLTPVYLFVAVFWALFDQTSSTWIYQSQNMDRNFLGFNWLPSQIQSLNSVFVLTFIPLFSYLVYPWFGKVWPLSPLRKMGIGFILMSAAFVMVSVIQEWIDAGGRPNIAWQIAAFALLTASEIMISIVALEFAYTQAPRNMKSFIMCFYLAAVAIGNFLVVAVNHHIRVPSGADEQLVAAIGSLPSDWQTDPRTVVLPGYDGRRGTQDDLVQRLENGKKRTLEFGERDLLDAILGKIVRQTKASNKRFPTQEEGDEIVSAYKDRLGNPVRYEILNAHAIRIRCAGGDGRWNTKWDVGIIVQKPEEKEPETASWTDRLRPRQTWLERRKQSLGMDMPADGGSEDRFSITPFCGGQPTLRGAAYFWFFSALMGLTAILFVPFAMLYRPKNYLQE